LKPLGAPAGSGAGSSGGSPPGHRLDCSEHPTALVCHTFANDKSVKDVWISPRVPCVPEAVYDPSEAAARLTIGTLCGANSAGEMRFSYPTQKGQFWLQFRFKQEQGFIDEPMKLNLPSPKIFVLWSGNSSCSAHEFAQVNQYWRGYPQFYENCGAITTQKRLPPFDYDLQPGGETSCHYQAPLERPGEKCLRYRAEWATHTFHLDLDGAEHGGAPWVEGWIQYDDESKRTHIISAELVRTRQLQHIYFSPYMTGKSNRIDHPQWKVWFQDILITTERLIPR
jgi:hypothetical protein